MGRGDRGVQRVRHGARADGHRRRRARGRRARLVDAVAAAPHRELTLAALGADTLACSAYKWYGPHIGILCAAPALLEELGPDKLRPSPEEAPDRFELGTLPFESLAG